MMCSPFSNFHRSVFKLMFSNGLTRQYLCSLWSYSYWLKTFRSCWSYNVIFEQLHDPPHIHYLGSLAALDDNVFIMGGEFSDTFALYKNKTWTYEQDWNYRPLHMRDFTTATINNFIFVFGGHDDKIEGPSGRFSNYSHWPRLRSFLICETNLPFYIKWRKILLHSPLINSFNQFKNWPRKLVIEMSH